MYAAKSFVETSNNYIEIDRMQIEELQNEDRLSAKQFPRTLGRPKSSKLC